MQFKTCLTKNIMVYWRNTEYNAVRYSYLRSSISDEPILDSSC